MGHITRRNFLKLAVMAPAALAFSQTILPSPLGAGSPNIIVLVFDAMSADNLSLYGYPRKTTPNFERLAHRSTVYHSHYSAGNFTTPGTASLLTGLYPWTHRAINQKGQVAPAFVDKNIFSVIGKSYVRAGFGQNVWAELLLGEFHSGLDVHLPPGAFSVLDQLAGSLLGKDSPIGYYAYDDFLDHLDGPPSSLVFGLLDRALFGFRLRSMSMDDYPFDIPHSNNYKIYYKLENVFSGLLKQVKHLEQPYLAYFHLWSPHAPYTPRQVFLRVSKDGWNPPAKPNHPLGRYASLDQLESARRRYDAYVANVDWEFGNFLGALDASRLFDKTYLVLTSDHGEMFERGVVGHGTPLMYDAGLRVPLLISAPGRKTRNDVYSQTNSVDVLPTLLKIAGHDIPAWAEGQLLPGFGGGGDDSRPTFSLQAGLNSSFGRLSIASLAMRKNGFKMIYYKGYKEYQGADSYELYNMRDDPQELTDLYHKDDSMSKVMQAELLAAFNEHSGPLQG